MEARLRQALARAEEVSRELSDPATARDSKRLTTLGREHARLVPIVRTAERLRRIEDELAQAREMAQEADPELVALARSDVERLPAGDTRRLGDRRRGIRAEEEQQPVTGLDRARDDDGVRNPVRV